MACLEQTEWGYDYAVGAERQGRTRDLFNQFSSWMTHNMVSFGRGGVVGHGAHTEITHMLKRPQCSLYKELLQYISIFRARFCFSSTCLSPAIQESYLYE